MGTSEKKMQNQKFKFQVNDSIFVPTFQQGMLNNYPFAFFKTTVKQVEGRSIIFEYGDKLIKVGSGMCHKNISILILILNIGDFQTEATLLDPLAKSVLQYSRLLFDDSYVKHYKVRTLEELKYLWAKEHNVYTHIVMIGHGCKNGFIFNDKIVSVQELKSIFDAPSKLHPKVFISLCCKTGKKSVAEEFSKMKVCSCFIAPFSSIHGVNASLFLQTLFANHFLNGNSINVACKNTLKGMKSSVPFRVWEDGVLGNSTHTTK